MLELQIIMFGLGLFLLVWGSSLFVDSAAALANYLNLPEVLIGADILNFLLVGAASAVICPAPYPESILKLELPFIFLLLFLLCIPSILQKKATRLQGILLLSFYALYLFLLNI